MLNRLLLLFLMQDSQLYAQNKINESTLLILPNNITIDNIHNIYLFIFTGSYAQKQMNAQV